MAINHLDGKLRGGSTLAAPNSFSSGLHLPPQVCASRVLLPTLHAAASPHLPSYLTFPARAWTQVACLLLCVRARAARWRPTTFFQPAPPLPAATQPPLAPFTYLPPAGLMPGTRRYRGYGSASAELGSTCLCSLTHWSWTSSALYMQFTSTCHNITLVSVCGAAGRCGHIHTLLNDHLSSSCGTCCLPRATLPAWPVALGPGHATIPSELVFASTAALRPPLCLPSLTAHFLPHHYNCTCTTPHPTYTINVRC